MKKENKNQFNISTNFIDLTKQQYLIRDKLDAAIKKVLDHGKYIMGPEVYEFEENLIKFSGAKFVSSCANGTDALTISMMALKIKKGDYIIAPSFTYIASVEAAAILGINPIFVDVNMKTYNIDPKSVKEAILFAKKNSLNLKAIIAVDLFGLPHQYDEIKALADENNIKIIHDAAQSFGAKYKEKRVGSYADITTTSFFPAKPLGCYGDGGAVLTNDEESHELIKSIRLHGKGIEKYDHVNLGMNSRLDSIQAAILNVKLELFPEEIRKRNKVAKIYLDKIDESLQKPLMPKDCVSTWAQFTIQSHLRDKIISTMEENEIPYAIYYPKPLHLQPAYTKYLLTDSPSLENSEMLSSNVISLPMHPYLSKEEIFGISEVINSAIK
tara:strand:+ start:6087 stop:7238 length:1152 start_codon:yes stop_codon:yes gene_type:complete